MQLRTKLKLLFGKLGKKIRVLLQLLGFPGGSVVKNLPANAGDVGSVPGQKDLLEKEVANHSSILAWEIPGAEEPGGL